MRERGRERALEPVATSRAACAPRDDAVGAYERRPAGRQAVDLGERLGVDDMRRRRRRRSVVDGIPRRAQHDELRAEEVERRAAIGEHDVGRAGARSTVEAGRRQVEGAIVAVLAEDRVGAHDPISSSMSGIGGSTPSVPRSGTTRVA